MKTFISAAPASQFRSHPQLHLPPENSITVFYQICFQHFRTTPIPFQLRLFLLYQHHTSQSFQTIPNSKLYQTSQTNNPKTLSHIFDNTLYAFSYSRQMHRQTSKKETHHKHHEHSLDDFLKNAKKNNLKSERYDRLLSPDPFAPYRQNTLHTLDRSRTLSGKHSHKTNKTTRQRVQKILSGSLSKDKPKHTSSKKTPSQLPSKSQSATALPDPADLISQFSRRIRQTEHFLEGKSKMGVILCKKFLDMLNKIVQNMVLNFQHNLEQLEKSISDRLEREIGERAERRVTSLQRKFEKLQNQTRELINKENLNNNLIYHLRLQNIDVDREFGRCIYNSDDCGGRGYKRNEERLEDEERDNDPNYTSNSELVFVRQQAQYIRQDQSQGNSSGNGSLNQT